MQNERVLFILSNGSQVKIFSSVAKKFLEAGAKILFINPDGYYQQNAEKELRSYDFPFESVFPSSPTGGWWQLSLESKEKFLFEAEAQLEKIIIPFSPTIAITSNTMGEIEQMALRQAEFCGALTVQIQDGIIHSKLLPLENQQIHPLMMLDGGCDLLCVWSEGLKEKLIERGMSGKIEVTGNPRYDLHKDYEGYKKKNHGPYKVLIAGQCFARYGNMTPAQEISIYHRLCALFLSRDDVEIVFKPHPQTDIKEAYKELEEFQPGRVTIVWEGDSVELLKGVDLLVTVSSTVSLESQLMGIPTARLEYYQHTKTKYFLPDDEKFKRAIKDKEFPFSFSQWAQPREEIIKNYCISFDGKATERVWNAIGGKLSEKRRQVQCEEPQVSIVIDLYEQDVLSSIQSALKGESVEVIALDYSQNGTLGILVMERIKDSRLVVKSCSGKSLSDSLKETFLQCRGEFILRLDGRSQLYPGSISKFVKPLRSDSRIEVVTSGFALRTNYNVAFTQHTLSLNSDLEMLSRDQRWPLFTRVVAFRKRSVQQIEIPKDNDISFELKLMACLVKDLKSKERFACIPEVLFHSPYLPQQSKITLLKSSVEVLPESKKIKIEVKQEAPAFSILLCCYNREDKVGKCLEALSRQTIESNRYEVICVNDGSSDRTGEIMKAGLKNLQGKYIEHEKNKALAAARNTAIKESTGKLLVFINDDTYVQPNFLEEHLKTHQEMQNENIAVLGFLPFIEKYKNRIFSLALMQENLYFGYTGMEPRVAYPFWFFITGNLSVPRKAFLQNNIWFDESFIRYGYEDIDCGLRLWQKGLRVYYNPKAQALHDHHITIENFVSREESNAANIIQFCIKHPYPEIAQTLLTVPFLTEATLQEWKQFVERSKEQVDAVISEISKSQEMYVSGADGQGVELVRQIGAATRMVAFYVKIKTFLEVFEKYPQMKQALLKQGAEERPFA